MANQYGSNSTNDTKMNKEGGSVQVVYLIVIVINGVSSPFTVLLNVLVIMAVKRRPRFQSNTNILLACLAVTDALTGLTVQPSFIAWKSFLLQDIIHAQVAKGFHNILIRTLSGCSALLLALVTLERLIAIKFTMHYHNIVTKHNIKVSVIAVWAYTIISEVVTNKLIFTNLLFALTLIFCVVFIASSYVILYRDSRRHEKMIKAQQLSQEEVERFAKENKALKTTVFVVGAVLLSFLPMALAILLRIQVSEKKYVPSIVTTDSHGWRVKLLNPLIYRLRQKEMRKFVLRVPCGQAVEPALN